MLHTAILFATVTANAIGSDQVSEQLAWQPGHTVDSVLILGPTHNW